jgi:hypothetical protein
MNSRRSRPRTVIVSDDVHALTARVSVSHRTVVIDVHPNDADFIGARISIKVPLTTADASLSAAALQLNYYEYPLRHMLHDALSRFGFVVGPLVIPEEQEAISSEQHQAPHMPILRIIK